MFNSNLREGFNQLEIAFKKATEQALENSKKAIVDDVQNQYRRNQPPIWQENEPQYAERKRKKYGSTEVLIASGETKKGYQNSGFIEAGKIGIQYPNEHSIITDSDDFKHKRQFNTEDLANVAESAFVETVNDGL